MGEAVLLVGVPRALKVGVEEALFGICLRLSGNGVPLSVSRDLIGGVGRPVRGVGGSVVCVVLMTSRLGDVARSCPEATCFPFGARRGVRGDAVLFLVGSGFLSRSREGPTRSDDIAEWSWLGSCYSSHT